MKRELGGGDTKLVRRRIGRAARMPALQRRVGWAARAPALRRSAGSPGRSQRVVNMPFVLGAAQLDGLAGSGRFVNGGHDLHVAQALFAGHAGGRLLQNAAREVVHFDRELIGRG
jgi:hypothetical protein